MDFASALQKFEQTANAAQQGGTPNSNINTNNNQQNEYNRHRFGGGGRGGGGRGGSGDMMGGNQSEYRGGGRGGRGGGGGGGYNNNYNNRRRGRDYNNTNSYDSDYNRRTTRPRFGSGEGGGRGGGFHGERGNGGGRMGRNPDYHHRGVGPSSGALSNNNKPRPLEDSVIAWIHINHRPNYQLIWVNVPFTFVCWPLLLIPCPMNIFGNTGLRQWHHHQWNVV